MPQKFSIYFRKAGVMNLLRQWSSSVQKFSLQDYQKNWKSLLKNGKSNIHLLFLNLTFNFIHWLNLLVLKILQKKDRSLHVPWEINRLPSKLESQNLSTEVYDPRPEIKFKETTDPNTKSKSLFRSCCNFCHKSNHCVSNCFRQH